ncbi:MAG: FAD-dependent oxidoreductase [Pseudomonadota bacterium]
MTDVTILGGGIFGLSIAWACLGRGAQVRVIERRGIGAGASGGIVGALAPHVPENWNVKKQFQFDSLIAAREWWPEVEAVSGLETGYQRTGRLQPVLDARQLELAHARAENAKMLWQGKAEWEVTPVTSAGWEPPSPTGTLIHDTLSAHIYPRKAVQALARAVEVKGGEIVIGEGELEGHVIHATGYEGLVQDAQTLGKPFGNGVKGQALLLGFDAHPDAPQLFADALHIVPHGDGTVAIGSTSEREFDDPSATDAQLDEVHARALKAFPVLKDAPVLARWAGIRPRAKSRAPVLGAHPVHQGQYIANGGFKIGFGMAPKVADVMADLVLEGRDTIPDSFRPEASLA